MAKINQITFEHDSNYAVYDDCDSMTDYFNIYYGSLKRIIEVVKEDGGVSIECIVVNDDSSIPGLRRAKRVAKACGYTLEDVSAESTRNGCFGPITRMRYSYMLTKEA